MKKDDSSMKDDMDKAMPEENVDKGMSQDKMMQDDADKKDMGTDTMKKDDSSMKDDMDKTMPEKNSSEEQNTSEQNDSVTGVLNT